MAKRVPKAKPTGDVPAAEVVAVEEAAEPAVQSIKGLNQDFACRGFQFEIGKSYEVTGRIAACENGFHACPTEEHPFSVFEYYPPSSRFALVTQAGKSDRQGNKLASAKITIDAEISLGDLAKRAIDWVFKQAKWSEGPVATKPNEGVTASGYRGAATASGDRGAATASGYRGAATASGDRGAATASGYRGAATASGDRGAATASGNQGAATASGNQGAATASGDQGAATASGYECKARGKAGNALFAVERNDDYEIISVACGIVGRDEIEADVWYLARAGKLVRA
jgi:hypothetical protein